ncbi:MAG: D-3-phosphoglycerate dehydrogenase [uncultured bacterium]|nr:MAG: D-3-phosphoglycerate dehydrogenase [uncultured bacterium]
MVKAKIIGKIILNDSQINKLAELGVTDIAKSNPNNRDDAAEIIRRIDDAEAIIINISTYISEEVIQNCPKLRFIQTWSTGIDNIDVRAAEKRKIIVKNVPGFSTESVAEKTIGLMIFIANRLREANLDVKVGNWNYTKFQGMELNRKILCIIGKGKIGTRVGELASAFGMTPVFANSKTTKEELRNRLSQADFISLHCPYNENTHHLISTYEFNSMKKGVYFVNNARGGIVDEVAFANALDSGIIEAASIDVFEQEPPKKDNVLLNHPKVFVTPHCAWNTKEAVQKLTDVCIENLTEYFVHCSTG